VLSVLYFKLEFFTFFFCPVDSVLRYDCLDEEREDYQNLYVLHSAMYGGCCK